MRARVAFLAGVVLAAACGRDEAFPTSPSEAERAQRAEAARIGAPATFRNAWGMRFALIPPARVVLGSPDAEPGRAEEEAAHEVALALPYYLACEETPAWAWRALRPDAPDVAGPATGMTHDEAVAFARRLSESDPDWDYRLPTEAEWEHGCRALDPGSGLADAARKNPWGLEGVHGGPWEWCADWWAPYPSWYVTNPGGPPAGETRVLRGGSWSPEAPPARSAQRERRPPGERHPRIGFRLLAEVGYGGNGRGSCSVVFRAIDLDAPAGERDREGWRVRLVAVFDRLSARQIGKPLPWIVLPGATPLRTTLVPGRYYAQCEREIDGRLERGLEMKILLSPPGEPAEIPLGTPDGEAEILLPVPKGAATSLDDPQ